MVSDQARIETQMHHQLQLHNQSPSALLGSGLGSATWNKKKKKENNFFISVTSKSCRKQHDASNICYSVETNWNSD